MVNIMKDSGVRVKRKDLGNMKLWISRFMKVDGSKTIEKDKAQSFIKMEIYLQENLQKILKMVMAFWKTKMET